MSTTILVPLDGSELARQPLPYAITLAKRAGARLILVRVTSPVGWVHAPQAELDVRDELEAVAGRIRLRGIEVETHVEHAYYADVGAAIAEAAAKRGAALIAMSTHGRGGLGRWMYGSVADAVLRRAEMPVLLVPDTAGHAWPSDRPLRVLVPLDGSALAEDGLAAACALAGLVPAELLLLRVVDPPNCGLQLGEMPTFAFDAATEHAAAQAYLEPLTAELRAEGQAARARVAGGFAKPTIAAIAREEHVDLVAMATHGHTGLARLVLGSVATATLQQVTVPLLLVRPAALRQQEPLPSSAVPAARPTTPTMDVPLTITLSPAEADLIERGLRKLLSMPEGERYLDPSLRALLEKLERGEETAQEAATAAAEPC